MALNDDQEKALKAELDAEKAKSAKAAADLADVVKKNEEKDKKKNKGKDKKDDEDDDEEDEDEEDDEDDDLRSKAKKERESAESKKVESKKVEAALKFNLGVEEFVKTYKDLLPGEIAEIVRIAGKETYDSAVERANALKASMIQSFFAVQENLDALTSGQKNSLEEYLKLTKNGKEAKAETIFENVLEPALETLKKIKKAEEVGKSRSGFSSGSAGENSYKDRLMKNSRKTHLGEKGA